MDLTTLIHTIETSSPDQWADCAITNGDPFKVYRPDIDIRLVPGSAHRERFNEPWVKQFPDPEAESYFLEIHYRGVPVDCVLMVSVDGARCAIPLPTTGTPRTISRYQYAIAQAINDPSRLDNNLRIADIVVA